MNRYRVLRILLICAGLAPGVVGCRPPHANESPANPCAACCAALSEPDPLPPPERVFFVDRTAAGASDSNPGTAAEPWLTIQHAVDVAQPGDQITIGEGVYSEPVVMVRSGEPGRPIVLKAAGNTVIDGTNFDNEKLVDWGGSARSHIVLDGLDIRNGAGWGVWILGDHNLVTNCLVHDHGRDPAWSVASGILVQSGDHNRIIGNDVWGNRWNGINVENANYTEIAYNRVHDSIDHMGINVFSNTEQFYGMMVGNDIHHNLVYWNGQSGIYTRYQMCNEISNNVVYGNREWGIFLHRGGQGGATESYEAYTTITNNTVTDNALNGLFSAGALSLTIVNNIFSRNSTDLADQSRAELRLEMLLGGDVVDHNLYDPADGATAAYVHYPDLGGLRLDQLQALDGGRYERDGVRDDPMFVDRAAADFHLAPGSQAIDSALDPGVRWTGTDVAGMLRPQGRGYDRGAFEYH